MRTTTATIISFAFLLSLPSIAGATPNIAVDAEPQEHESRTELDIGFLVGGEDVGPQRRFARGLQINIGRRFGDLALLAEYNYLRLGESGGGSRGSLSRAGVIARYSLLRTGSDRDSRGRRGLLSGDFWVEAGAGMQRISWDAGGRLHRPDGILGFGWQLNGVIGRNDNKPRYYGPYVAFRAHFTRAPAWGDEVMATCGGPCDRATKPSRNDVGLFFHMGVNWGR